MSKIEFSRRVLLALAGSGLATRPLAAADRIPLPRGKLRMVLDTDTYNEIDDQFAVAYAMLSPEQMQVEAIYAAPFLNSRSKSAGDGMEKSYEEILRVLDRLGKKGAVDVFRGSKSFLKDAGKPVDSPAARDLIQRAKAAREMLYVATVGAPTNVASALRIDPSIKDKITVVWLGGRPPHFSTANEFNLQQDPPASRTLFDSGVRFVMIPTTNISEQLRTTTVELAKFIKGKSAVGDYLYEIFVEYAKQNGRDPAKPWSKVIWDISAVSWLINPDWISTKEIPSPVLTDDLHWKTAPNRHLIRVATHVNRDSIFGDLFAKLANA